MQRRNLIAICLAAAALYALVVLIGLGKLHPPRWLEHNTLQVWAAWQSPSLKTLPNDSRSDSIRYGSHLFLETPWYAAAYVGNKLACGDCHIAGGVAPYAAPLVGTPLHFPMYSQRAGHTITLQDRIEECFTRSENGQPLPYDSREMLALVDYIQWLSQPQPAHLPFTGRGLIALPELKPNPARGAQIYAAQCAGCHGTNGAGSRPLFPPLWGPDSFNDGAGMNRIKKMAAYVQYNMPQNRKGNLSAQDAYDVAAFIHAQPRPAFNPKYKKY